MMEWEVSLVFYVNMMYHFAEDEIILSETCVGNEATFKDKVV
jgi:hypothetical protein